VRIPFHRTSTLELFAACALLPEVAPDRHKRSIYQDDAPQSGEIPFMGPVRPGADPERPPHRSDRVTTRSHTIVCTF